MKHGILVLLLALIFSIPTQAQTSSGILEGVVVEFSMGARGDTTIVESAGRRYEFCLGCPGSIKDSPQIVGDDNIREGTRVRVTYSNLTRSKDGRIYYIKALKVVNLSSPSTGSVPNAGSTGNSNQPPSVKRTPGGSYSLSLSPTQQQAVDAFLRPNRGLRLARYDDNKDEGDLEAVKGMMQRGEMQYPFAAWGDFNKDSFLDVALVFFKSNRAWQIVAFHGGATGQYNPVVITEGGGVINGLMYRQRENRVVFAAFDVAEGNFRWNGNRYVVKPLKGD